MRLAILSDIHLEHIFNVDAAVDYINAIRPVEMADILILAGDIWSLNSSNKYRYLDAFRPWAVEILFVNGNHEYYNTNPFTQGKDALTKLEKEGVRVLHPEYHRSFTYSDWKKTVKFVGTTAWYPDNSTVRKQLQNWSDQAYIKSFLTWWPSHQLEERKMLWEEVEENCVVVTHMLPSFQCVSPNWAGDPTNVLYVSDVEDLLIEKKPQLWISGHSHEPSDMIIGETRCVRNPIGYPSYIKDVTQIKILEINI
jgi:DNA repair exonuclease SbcCD nuclease subunit